MKKFFIAIFFCLLGLLIFIKKNYYMGADEINNINYGCDKIITRAQVAKMICFLYADKKKILECYKSRNINFLDSEPNNWFDKYINFVFEKKIMTGIKKNKFEPDSALTLSQAQYLLDKININNKIKLKLDDQNKNKFISYSLWTKLFIKAIKDLKDLNDDDLDINKNIKQEKIIILATSKQNNNILKGFVISDKNYYSCDNLELLDFDFYNKAINALVCDKEILAVLNYSDKFNLHAKLLKTDQNKILVKLKSITRYFELDKNLGKIYRVGNKKLNLGEICGLRIDSGKLVNIINQAK